MKKTNLQFNQLIMEMREAINGEYRQTDFSPRDTLVDVATLWEDSKGCTQETTLYWGLRMTGTILQDETKFGNIVREVYKIQCASDGTWSIEKL